MGLIQNKLNNLNEIINIIKQKSHVSLGEFIQLSLCGEYGYYIHKNPFEQNNVDFITSSELSQIFGELIGVFLADCWIKMSRPKFSLIELGAGRGSLIWDILNATKNIPNFHESLSLHIVEINPFFEKMQRKKLENFPHILAKTIWYKSVNKINTHLPSFIYSNEFFDCLGFNQYIYRNDSFHEVIVRYDRGLYLDIDTKKTLLNIDFVPKENDIIENSPESINAYKALLDIIEKNSGLILTIDYGYTEKSKLSSIRGYKNGNLLNIQEILINASNCDITYDVDFTSLLNLSHGATNKYQVINQRTFLEFLGFHMRLKALSDLLNDQQKQDLINKSNLLVDNNEMGNKFKVMLHSNNIDNIHGFQLLKKEVV